MQFNNIFTEGGERKIVMDHTFFKGYRKTALTPQEVVVSITIPCTRKVHFDFMPKLIKIKSIG